MESKKKVSAFQEDSLGKYDTVDLAEKIKCGDLDVSQVTQDAIKRAKKVNPQLNAIAVEDFESALTRSAGPFPGVFQGVPTFFKDTDEVKGLPLYLGSQSLPGEISTRFSKTTQQILATGLNHLGTTTTPEFGLTGTTESMRFGATRNPWNTDYSTGGSSGGSSALVAAGVIPIAHANDGAGSIRIPASCCGLVGLKASRGRIKDKEVPGYFPANILHDGVVTRTVRDTWAFHTSIEKQNPAKEFPPIGEISETYRTDLRIAVLTENCHGIQSDDVLVEAAHDAARTCESLGHNIEIISNPFYKKFDQDFWLLWTHLAFYLRYGGGKEFSSKFDPSQLETWPQFLVKHHWKNIHKLPIAFLRLRKFASDYEKLLEGFDILLTPTLGTTPPKIGFFGPDVDGETHWHRINEYLPFTKYQNISGAPAITLPCSTDSEGLPIGIQFASRLGEDRLLLKLSKQLEEASSWKSLS
jgi:amidase